ncbi:MAG: HNH endonuclease signature motif containing protein [Acidimicrobiales bacterium]
MIRLLRARDQGCRFPGCRARAFVDAHHIRDWAAGGPTDMTNTLLICRVHHRAVHEGGWRIEGDPEGELTFVGPAGQVLPHPPEPLRSEISERFLPSWDGATAGGGSGLEVGLGLAGP